MEKLVIVGGGIAGLSCLNALLDQGVSPLLIEASRIGTPKMCGEFIAPQAVALLQKWQIGPIQCIKQAAFFAQAKDFNLVFPQSAGAIARHEVELQLATRARAMCGRIKENSPIKVIVPATLNNPFEFHLASGEKIQSDWVIFATGKYAQQSPVPAQNNIYFGIKLHLPRILLPETLLMYAVKKAYFGFIPIADEMSNCACLAKREEVEKVGSCKEYFYALIEANKYLSQVFASVNFNELNWLQGQTPEFGLKQTPSWPRTLWIGDAIGSLYPAIGSGFAHGMASAMMAATYYLKKDALGYKKAALRDIYTKLKLGKYIHQLLLNPFLAPLTIPALKINPWFVQVLLKKLGFTMI